MLKANKKVTTEEKKEFLDENFKPTAIMAKFFVKELTMKESQWRMKLKVEDILPRTYYRYQVEMIFDEEPYNRRINSVRDQIADVRDAKQKPLFDDADEKISDLEDEMATIEKNMEAERAECPTIKMPARVEELKYSGNDTMLVFRIPDHVIEQLNKNKLKFGSYILELTPEF